jgi:hypothetical protein
MAFGCSNLLDRSNTIYHRCNMSLLGCILVAVVSSPGAAIVTPGRTPDMKIRFDKAGTRYVYQCNPVKQRPSGLRYL